MLESKGIVSEAAFKEWSTQGGMMAEAVGDVMGSVKGQVAGL